MKSVLDQNWIRTDIRVTMSDMDVDDAALQRLAVLVTKRRVSLGLTIQAAAAAAPMSPTTWSHVENGRLVRRGTYAALDRVLQFDDGHSWKLLTTDSQPVTEGAPDEDRTAAAIARMERDISQIEVDPDLNEEFKRQVVANLRATLELTRLSIAQAQEARRRRSADSA